RHEQYYKVHGVDAVFALAPWTGEHRASAQCRTVARGAALARASSTLRLCSGLRDARLRLAATAACCCGRGARRGSRRGLARVDAMASGGDRKGDADLAGDEPARTAGSASVRAADAPSAAPASAVADADASGVERPSGEPCLIIGIGASAGGLS